MSEQGPLAGVCGWPVRQSLSPVIMAFWLDKAGIAGRYLAYPLSADDFPNGLKSLGQNCMTGLSVTIPHKETALALADTASDAARRIGAANLALAGEDGAVHVDNTDVVGVRAALDEGGWTSATGPALLIGAGGAARAALAVLADAGADIRILNRTRARAERLAIDFGVEAEIFTPDAHAEAINGAGLIINASSQGMGETPSPAFALHRAAPGALVFDMVYNPLETGLLKAAKAAGLKTVDGLTMLIAQARPAFAAFYGAPAPDDDPRPALLAALEARR